MLEHESKTKKGRDELILNIDISSAIIATYWPVSL